VSGSGLAPANAADFGGALPGGTLNFAPGVTSQTLTINVSGDLVVEADEGFTVTLANVSGSGASLGTSAATGTIQNDDLLPPPSVTKVFVRGSGWASTFVNGLDASGLGYPIPVGSSHQLDSLPWTALNQVIIKFSENVKVEQDDLVLKGATVTEYAFSGFVYDSVNYTATWTVSGNLGPDKLLIDLDGDGVDPVMGRDSGLILDGEWTDSSSVFPSGNAIAGGDFEFRFDVLPGDVNNSGVVLSNDVILVRNKQFQFVGSPTYSFFLDVDGSGTILSNDVVLVRNRQFTSLPSGPAPTGIPSPGTSMLLSLVSSLEASSVASQQATNDILQTTPTIAIAASPATASDEYATTPISDADSLTTVGVVAASTTTTPANAASAASPITSSTDPDAAVESVSADAVSRVAALESVLDELTIALPVVRTQSIHRLVVNQIGVRTVESGAHDEAVSELVAESSMANHESEWLKQLAASHGTARLVREEPRMTRDQGLLEFLGQNRKVRRDRRA
jgi:hypothetical protein